MVSKKIANILLWISYVCWILIIPILIFCDSDQDRSKTVAFGSLYDMFFHLINLLTANSMYKILKDGPYIIAIFVAVIFLLLSLLWLVPCLKSKKRATMIVSATTLIVFNLFFMAIFIFLFDNSIQFNGHSVAIVFVVLRDNLTAYHTGFVILIPAIVSISSLIPYIWYIVVFDRDLSVDKQEKDFNSQRKAAIDLNKGQLGATGKQPIKTMISNQEIKTDPSSVNDLKSKVNRLKSQLENKDYTNSFQANNNFETANDEYNPDFSNDNQQNNGYVPTSELFIRPPRVSQSEFDNNIDFNSTRNGSANNNGYEEEGFYDNNDFSVNKNKVTSNFIYPATEQNGFSEQQHSKTSGQIGRNQNPFNIANGSIQPRIKRAVVDSKYNNKIVIGDTDKIWNATKKAREQYSKNDDADE